MSQHKVEVQLRHMLDHAMEAMSIVEGKNRLKSSEPVSPALRDRQGGE